MRCGLGDLVLSALPPTGTQYMLVNMAAQGQRMQMGPNMLVMRDLGHILSLPSRPWELYIRLFPASRRTDLMMYSEA